MATADGTALYRIWGDAGLLIYIGISDDFGRRWKEHARKQPWWDEMKRLTVDECFDSREDAEAAEEAAIDAEYPKYNQTHSSTVRRRRSGTGRLRPVYIDAALLESTSAQPCLEVGTRCLDGSVFGCIGFSAPRLCVLKKCTPEQLRGRGIIVRPTKTPRESAA